MSAASYIFEESSAKRAAMTTMLAALTSARMTACSIGRSYSLLVFQKSANPSHIAMTSHQMGAHIFLVHNPNAFGTRLMSLHFDPLFSPCRAFPHVICPSVCLVSSHIHSSFASHTPIFVCCRTPLRSLLLCLPFLVHEIMNCGWEE